MFAMRSHISVAEEKVGVLVTTMHRMGPDISNLRDAMIALYDSVVKLKVRDVTCMVDDILRGVESIECGHSGPTREDVNTHMLKPVYANTTSDAKGSLKSLNRSVEVKKQGQRRFRGVANLSPIEMDMLKYLFSKKAPTEDSLGSAEVWRFREFSVSLGPFEPRPLTLYKQRATITMCKLHKYYGQLQSCRKIFIPINDDVLDHWFLVVVNITEDECEIWDNITDLPAQQCLKNLVNDVFNSYDERVRIALEIVNNPINECYKKFGIVRMLKRMKGVHLRNHHTTEGVDGGEQEPFRATMVMKFKPHVLRRS
ncbi:hypothetical protein ACLB2K_020232 [Fragaria x ananassa]